MVNNYFDI